MCLPLRSHAVSRLEMLIVYQAVYLINGWLELLGMMCGAARKMRFIDVASVLLWGALLAFFIGQRRSTYF